MEYYSKEPLGKNREALLTLYEQSCENARAYMDLRFKHFTTFMFLTGLLGAITFQVDDLRNFRPLFCITALFLTILFWLLDNRTSYHQQIEILRIQRYELLIGAPIITPPKKRLRVRATLITNLIFLIILLSWGVMGYVQVFYRKIQPPTIQNPAIEAGTPQIIQKNETLPSPETNEREMKK